MEKQRIKFRPEVVSILLGILAEHYSSLTGRITDWDKIAEKVTSKTEQCASIISLRNWFNSCKLKHKAWNELEGWTGIGLTDTGCPIVDVEGDKWKAFAQRYRCAASFLKTPLQNEAEWDKILKRGCSTGKRLYTPSSVVKHKEVFTVKVEGSSDSDDSGDFEDAVVGGLQEVDLRRKCRSVESMTMPSKKRARVRDIDTCLNISKPKNKYVEVVNILESMGIAKKYGNYFFAEIIETIRKIPDSIELFTSQGNDTRRLHFLKIQCSFPDEV